MGNFKSNNKNTETITMPNLSAPSLSDESNSICEINFKTKFDTNFLKGFLLHFYIDQEAFYCLIFSINNNNFDLINNNIINVSYDNNKRNANIKIDKNKRYIKNLTVLFVIEILEEDKIPKEYFLYLDILNIIINNKLINTPIYIPYNKGKELKLEGVIKEINKYEFIHSIKTKDNLMGYPIICESSFNVIGINKKENSGNFIYPIIKIIEEEIKEKRNKGKYEKGKYIWEDGKYYEGEFKNNLPNGKGIKYYPNGNILFEGNFFNGKFEGKGKYIYDDGV